MRKMYKENNCKIKRYCSLHQILFSKKYLYKDVYSGKRVYRRVVFAIDKNNCTLVILY